MSELLRVTRLLASSVDEQVRYVRALGVGPDEIALEFDDACRGVRGLSEMGVLPGRLVEGIRPLDRKLQTMTASAKGLWSESGMLHSSEWEELRSLAGAVCAVLQRAME